MVTLIGIILLALGVSLAVVWRTPFLDVLMGLIPLTLIFWGVVVVLIGYAEIKARREYRDAVSDSDFDAAPTANARPQRGNRNRYAQEQETAATPSAAASTPSNGTPASTAPSSPPNHSN